MCKTAEDLNIYIGKKYCLMFWICSSSLYVDEYLKWDLNFDYVYKKLVKFVGIFYKLGSVLPVQLVSKITLFKYYVGPLLQIFYYKRLLQLFCRPTNGY